MPSDFAPLLREPLDIIVAGTRVRIPYRPAAVWAKGMERLPVLAATLADDAGRAMLLDLVIDHDEGLEDLRQESLRILEEASGRRWWEAGRLLSTSVQPEILGRLVLAGADAHTRSLGEWCAATYALCTKGADEKGRIRFDFSLSMPPSGYEDAWDDGGDDPAATMDAVQALMGKK